MIQLPEHVFFVLKNDLILNCFQIIEITGLTTDAALVALHDCDNDTDRAAIMLLEGNQDEVNIVDCFNGPRKNNLPEIDEQIIAVCLYTVKALSMF